MKVLVALILLALPVVAWDHAVVPLGWVGLWLGAVLAWAGVRGRATVPGKLAYGLGWVAIALGLVEFGAWWRSAPEVESHDPKIYVDDELIGQRLRPGATDTHSKALGERTVFDVTYTIGEHGRRVVRPATAPPSEGAEAGVHLFGCSFMFGYGLEDEESVPWRVQEALGGAFRVYNWGQPAQGAHHALARVEFGEVERAATEPAVAAVYWAIGDHTRRLLGERSWDSRGPSYELDGEGRAVFAGTFEERFGTDERRKGLLGRSWLARGRARLADAGGGDHAVADGDLDRWGAIVERLRDELRVRDPGIRFVVLLDAYAGDRDLMARELEARGLPYLETARILDATLDDVARWRIDEVDAHANAAATERIAAAIVDWLRGEGIGGVPSPRAGD